MPLAKLSSKSQIVLPANLRSQLKLKAGDLLEITGNEEEIRIRKAPKSYVDALAECASETWRNYETELDTARDTWDG